MVIKGGSHIKEMGESAVESSSGKLGSFKSGDALKDKGPREKHSLLAGS